MKSKKHLVTILLVFAIAITILGSSAVLVACDDNNDAVEPQAGTVENLLNALIGYVVSGDNRMFSIDCITDISDDYEEVVEEIGAGYFSTVIASDDTTQDYFYLYVYDTAENANNGYNLLANNEYHPFGEYFGIVDSNCVLEASSKEFYETVKSSTLPSGVLSQKQLDFMRTSFKDIISKEFGRTNSYLYRDSSLSNELSWVYSSGSYKVNFDLVELYSFTDSLSNESKAEATEAAQKIGTEYTDVSYINIDDDGIYCHLVSNDNV